MANSPYQNLEIITSALKKRTEEGDWEGAAQLAAQLEAQISSPSFPDATPADRSAIEAALTHIASITEYAGPLREDMARLLQAFDSSPPRT